MKKIYTTLALAAVVCASASAVKPVEVSKCLKAKEVSNLEFVQQTVNRAPAKAVTRSEMKDFTGAFTIGGEWALKGDAPGVMNVTISQVSGDQVSMTIAGYGSWAILGTVDVAKNTLTFTAAANTNIGTAQEGTVCFWVADITEEGMVAKDKTVGTLQPDGSIVFGGINEFVSFKSNAVEGYYFAMRDFALNPPDYFTYNASDWNRIGTCDYEEFVINPLMKEPVGVVSVELYKSLKAPNQFLIKNPYASGDWAQVNWRPETEGYLVCDLNYDGCIALRPLTPSGFWMDFSEEEDGSEMEELYIFNLEGTYIFIDEMDPREVEDAMLDMDYDLSTYNAKTRIAQFNNVYFGETSSPASYYSWVESQNPNGSYNLYDLWVELVMPEGVVGVTSVMADGKNLDKKFYNMQGVEIAAPTAGEVVIVKEGNRTYKALVR